MNWNSSYSPETPNLGQIRQFLEPCGLEIWRMTLKNNRAPLLSIIKLYASFHHHHMWIQTGVTVRKQLSWVVTSVTLTFDLWLWPFAWTSLLSLVITPENFMMVRWWEHSQKGVTDGRTDWTIHRAAWSQLKSQVIILIPSWKTFTWLWLKKPKWDWMLTCKLFRLVKTWNENCFVIKVIKLIKSISNWVWNV